MPRRTVESPPRSPAGDAFGRVAFQLLKLGALVSAAGDELARPAGQTSARWQVLAAVEDAPASVASIARALGLARQSVQRVADVLAAEGLAVYEDNPEHARAKLLRLAPPGRAVLRAIQARQRGWSDALGTELGEADLRRAGAILDRVLAALVRRATPADGA